MLRELNRLAERYGFEPGVPTSGSHFSFQHSTNKRKAFSGGNKTDPRSLKNFEAILRRIAQLPPLRPGERDETQ